MSIYMLTMSWDEDTKIQDLPYNRSIKDDTIIANDPNRCPQAWDQRHEFKLYKGFNSDYYYCIYCDAKKELSESEK